ncbi:nucleoside diphosphate kinase regulator [Neoroseomonas oryzicola]|uniref:Nucleoside diphosphate kinase regulator n=1 Tax=Neoroseomonas oryzicola TaxID=535904 RepID=A0A9X9WPV3_9PROT|nr:nucleoside diphosphate kinase regulator [Neoroseomonas oryzicola]MBR0662363.1 nucleoside diphosphate kinase regulator [Neoroseomonas oryzicola]NKE19471.1 nucleoside diphosphate kinase regulator [Neoroseomonas oryzicola]
MANATTVRPTTRRPPILLSDSDHDILIGLAASAARRTPDAARLLLEEADRADLVPAGRLPRDVVALGSHVTFTDAATGTTRRVQLVMPAEADIGQGRISILSLVGAGLIGLRAGQSIDWPVQDGRLRRLTVVEVAPG